MPRLILRYCCCYQRLKVLHQQPHLRELDIPPLRVEQHVRVRHSNELAILCWVILRCCCHSKPPRAMLALWGFAVPARRAGVDPAAAHARPPALYTIPIPVAAAARSRGPMRRVHGNARRRHAAIFLAAIGLAFAAGAALVAAADAPAAAAAAAEHTASAAAADACTALGNGAAGCCCCSLFEDGHEADVVSKVKL